MAKTKLTIFEYVDNGEDLNLARMEKDLITKAYSRYSETHTMDEIAAKLGMSARNLHRKLKEYNLSNDKKERKNNTIGASKFFPNGIR